MQLLTRIAPAVLVLLSTGCATVVRGTKQSIRIESNPAGAAIHLSTGMDGVTPAIFELPRKDPIVVEFRKDGYESLTVTLIPMRSKSGSIATGGNALVGGIIGGAIDGSTGAALDLEPNPLVVTLRQLRAPPTVANWKELQIGLARRDVRELLGEPINISDNTGDQVWTYSDGGKIQFHNFFVTLWNAPENG